VRDLIEAAAEPYLSAGMTVWEIARGKLRRDPVYLRILEDGVLPDRGRLVDIGCGQGLMLSLLATASARFTRGLWPASWPPAPAALELHGIEMRPRIAQQARDVLDTAAVIEERDVTTGGVPPCRAVLLIDVLHLMPRAAQDRVIAEVSRALAPSGVLVIREADAAGGWRFHLVRTGNRINAIVQGRFRRRFQFDSATGWRTRLADEGFTVDRIVPQRGGAFANFLLYARRPAA
jgi:SAM-dependent methyltransferase